MKSIYLAFAILGTIVPYFFFGQFMLQNGLDLILFVESLFANGAAGGFSADVLISSFTFWVFMFQKKSTNGINPIGFIALNLSIGLSCALPLYLYFSEKKAS